MEDRIVEEQQMYALWMSKLPGIGNVRGNKLIERFESPKGVYMASEEDLAQVLSQKLIAGIRQSKMTWKLQTEYEKMLAKDICMVAKWEKNYPGRLQAIPDAPFVLFYKGKLPEEGGVNVAIIGARDCSEYGRYVASELGRLLGRAQVKIISGMARGIDGISQMAALEVGGSSFGVLGCGVDICYPAQNRKLYESLLERGGLLSTYPPGTQPVPGNFPPRNRIVSGLADVVIVIEARQKSGTLITVDMALEQGREVYVVPGRITDRLSDGCNKLLKQGAGVLLSPTDFLQELMETTGGQTSGQRMLRQQPEVHQTPGRMLPEIQLHDKSSILSNVQQIIFDALDFVPQSTEQIRIHLPENITEKQLQLELMQLCMTGLAVQVSPGFFCKKEP